ncbi:inosine/xanthosine triphosphatase [Haloparvum sp. AD34]
MRVGVGSGNPVKRDAVAQVLGEGDGEFGADAAIEAVSVASGVSEQPTGHAETIDGAENRAANVLETDDYDLGVGVEGGVAEFEGSEGLYLVMWAAVDDGETVGRGSGPSMRLPREIERRVRDGEELGPVMDDVLDENEVARKQGAAGAFTNGRVDRTDALATAVAGALGPFATDLY